MPCLAMLFIPRLMLMQDSIVNMGSNFQTETIALIVILALYKYHSGWPCKHYAP